MAKQKTVYVCSQCGYETARWLGKCPDCGSWNTLTEQLAAPAAPEIKQLKRAPGTGAEPMIIDDIPLDSMLRHSTGIGELDRVLGGGIVEGSLLLVGGDPGIGKSTLLTQVSAHYAQDGHRVLYVSGEESARQIKMRAQRLGASGSQLYILSENDMSAVEKQMEKIGPDLMIVDSIQTMYRPDMAAAPGSVSQVRESASVLMRAAKTTGCAIILVGHVTKEGSLAGPRVLEHMVDAVLYFEGDRQHQYRLLRAVKNRFGSVNELGMFEMTSQGMREVENASEVLLSSRAHNQSGSVVMCAMEGSRPLLVDVQALVATTVFGNPRRMASGVDQGRLALLLAVLEKRSGLPLYNQDVYINIAGGMTLDEPGADLALCAAIASSHKNRVLGGSWAVMGEVGLAGEVRPVGQADRRVAECARMGFTDLILPHGNLRGLTAPDGLTLHPVNTLNEALRLLLG
ncbi:MAG: DNA repair protein RadA [Eubacteriales bacterium]|nr:DNA repair protein RadA [bacterium]MDY2791809.1 DNA repair protein RadA [Eubacteriales bacterium]